MKDLEKGVINQSIATKHHENVSIHNLAKNITESAIKSGKTNYELAQANKVALEEYKQNQKEITKSMSNYLNIQRMEEAKKSLNHRISLDDIEQSEEKPQVRASVSTIGKLASNIHIEGDKTPTLFRSNENSPLSSSASTFAFSSMGGTESTSGSPKMAKTKHGSPTADSIKAYLKHEIEKNRGGAVTAGLNVLNLNKGKLELEYNGNPQKTDKANLLAFYNQYQAQKEKLPSSAPKVYTSAEMESSTGLKIPKTKSGLINRFNLLRAEILNGNDNHKIILEIKHISKELYKKGYLKTHLE